jgi:RNA polymerase sigma-70 factor, ECF subfamily
MRGGDQRAFDRFFEGFVARIAAFAARRAPLDSAALEDVVQVTMIKAMNSIARFRGDCSLFTWLCGICRNHLADIHRKAGRQPIQHSLDEFAASGPPGAPPELTEFRDPLDETAMDSARRAVRHAVNQLPPSDARILELRYGDDLSVLEIARTLQLSESATESRLIRARQAFRASWMGEETTVLN